MTEQHKKVRNLEFRILGEKDLDSVLKLERESFSTPWTHEQYALLLKAGVCRLFGVSQAGRVLAYATVAMVKASAPAGAKTSGVADSGRGRSSSDKGASGELVSPDMGAPAGAEMEIYNIAVAADKRRQGLGKDLLSAVMAAAGALDIHRAVLEVREGNTAAIALYEALGFTQSGKRRNYYTNPLEDALVYTHTW